MNLTNDNHVGCQQIAAYGGLETMSSLIAGHFPSFSSSSASFSRIKENTSKSEIDHQLDVHLTDHELDFLVAILGLLVNLVEKDSHNRYNIILKQFLYSIGSWNKDGICGVFTFSFSSFSNTLLEQLSGLSHVSTSFHIVAVLLETNKKLF